MGVSNKITAVLNFIALLCSFAIIGAGIWLATKPDNECIHYFRWPVVILGTLTLLVSLAGFVGAYWNRQGLLAVYLFCMALLIGLLLVLLIFAFVVTRPDGSYIVPGRSYKEYRLEEFSTWLRDHVTNSGNWDKIRTCLSESDVCTELSQNYISADQFFAAHLSPFQGVVGGEMKKIIVLIYSGGSTLVVLEAQAPILLLNFEKNTIKNSTSFVEK